MGYRTLVRRRDVGRFLTAQAVSFLGDTSMWMACSIWVKTVTHSNGAAGLTFFFYLIPAIFNPLAGLAVDRVRRRPFLIGANLAGAAVLLPLFAVRSSGDVWVIYSVMFGYGIVNVAIGPAQSALLTEILPPSQLATANAALRSAQETLRILAPLVGAGLFDWLGGPAVALFDIATFLTAALLILTVSVKERHPAPARHRPKQDVIEGFAFLHSSAMMRYATIASVFLMLGAGVGESARWAVVSQGLHQGPSFIAVYQIAAGLGAIIAGIASSAIIQRTGELRGMAWGFALFVCGTALQEFGALVPA